MSGIFGGFAGGLVNLGMNLYNVNAQKKANAQNLAFAKEQFAYQQQLNNIAMEREDTAVSRRVADLENAGFNKRLAMDQAAGSQSLSSGNWNAGQQAATMDPSSILSGVTGSINAINQIRTTEADLKSKEFYNELQQAQTVKTLKEAGLLDKEIQKAIEDHYDRFYRRREWDSEYELRQSQKAESESRKSLYDSQKLFTDEQQKALAKENAWVDRFNGAPLSVQNSPRSFSVGPVNFSGPSAQVAHGMGEVREAMDAFINMIGDSPFSPLGFEGIQFANSLMKLFFGGNIFDKEDSVD